MSIPDLDTALGTLFDYDLNIYHTEEESIDEDGLEVWGYTDQWYVDIYEYLDRDQVHVAGPFAISALQRDLLQLGVKGTYFDEDDVWYGMWGFLNDYQHVLLPNDDFYKTLLALPKYKESVLI